MSIPLQQKFAVGKYILTKRLAGVDKFALVLQLEPLFQCNLECGGCGKIQYPTDILRRRLTVQECIDAALECEAPMVSIAGGEPLIHDQITDIVEALVARKRFVYLCTNAILMMRKIDLFKPSVYFSWSIHLDGVGARHDEAVCRNGIFDKAVEAVREAKARGFRVTTNTTFFNRDTPETIVETLNFLNDELQVDNMQIAPGYAYEKAPDQEHFLGVEQTRGVFREAFANGNRQRWRLNHTPLYLDFLEGKVDFACTAWGIPSYSVLGWQRPCYLMSDAPYAQDRKSVV